MGSLYCCTCKMKGGSIDVYCLFLNRGMQDAKSHSYSQAASRKSMIDVPHQIGNWSCRREKALKLVAQRYDESGQNVSGIGPVEVSDEIFELLLHSRTLNSRELT